MSLTTKCRNTSDSTGLKFNPHMNDINIYIYINLIMILWFHNVFRMKAWKASKVHWCQDSMLKTYWASVAVNQVKPPGRSVQWLTILTMPMTNAYKCFDFTQSIYISLGGAPRPVSFVPHVILALKDLQNCDLSRSERKLFRLQGWRCWTFSSILCDKLRYLTGMTWFSAEISSMTVILKRWDPCWISSPVLLMTILWSFWYMACAMMRRSWICGQWKIMEPK